MAVIINDRRYSNLFDASVIGWCLGNAGSWVKAEVDLVTIMDFLSVRDGMVTWNSLDNSLILNNGKEWREYGFIEDASYYLRVITNKTVLGVTTEISNEVVQVSEINGGIMLVDAPLALNQGMYPSVSVSGSDAVQWHIDIGLHINILAAQSVSPDQITTRYGLVNNQDIESGSLNSIIDGTVFEATVLNLGSVSNGTTVPMTILNTPSGMAVKSITMKKVTATTYIMAIEYMIHGLFSSGNNFLNEVVPDYFIGEASLGDNMEFEAFIESNNPNIFAQIEEQSQLIGNTGYFDENFNGLPNDFVIEDVLMVNELGQYQESISYNAKTRLVFKISSDSVTDWDGIKTQIGFFRAARQISEISNNGNSFLDNALVSNCYKDGSGSFEVGVNVSQIYGGWGNNGAEMKIIDPTFTTVDGKLNVEVTFSPNTAFANYILSKNENDRIFGIYLSIADNTDDLNISNRASLIISRGQMIAGLSLSGEYQNMNIRLVEHPYVAGQNDAQTVYGLPNDDISATINLWRDSTDEVEFIEVSYAIEAERNDGARFSLQRRDLDLSQSIIDSNDIQQINFIGSRGFYLSEGNEKNTVSLVRSEEIDQSGLVGYKGLYGFKVRWEDWIQLNGVNEDFYDANLPNNGFNQEWFRYSDKANWNTYFVVYLKAIINGEEVTYRNKLKFFVNDYFSNSNIDVSYLFRNAITGQALTGGTDTITGKQLGVILTNVNTEFEIRYEILSGIWEQAVVDTLYATVTIDNDQGAGELSMRQISSVIAQESGSPLLPSTGSLLSMVIDVDPTILIVKFQINPINLDAAVKYRFTGRLGCIADAVVNEGIYNSQYNNQYE